MSHESVLPITISTSPSYVAKCASSTSRASLQDPLTLILQAEKLPPTGASTITSQNTNSEDKIPMFPTSHLWPSDLEARLSKLSTEQLTQMIYNSAHTRLSQKLSIDDISKTFIVEAGNWSACVCWELLEAPAPRSTQSADSRSDGLGPELASEIKSIAVQGRVYFANFLTGIERAKHTVLYPYLWGRFAKTGDENDLKFWHIAILSRDPAVPRMDGAVRRSIEPFLYGLTGSRTMPTDVPTGTKDWLRTRCVWLEAGNERAREVYLRFGFEVVHEVLVGGVRTWMMIYRAEES